MSFGAFLGNAYQVWWLRLVWLISSARPRPSACCVFVTANEIKGKKGFEFAESLCICWVTLFCDPTLRFGCTVIQVFLNWGRMNTSQACLSISNALIDLERNWIWHDRALGTVTVSDWSRGSPVWYQEDEWAARVQNKQPQAFEVEVIDRPSRQHLQAESHMF